MNIPDEILRRVNDITRGDSTVYWHNTAEDSFVLVIEAYRRFLEITRDPRQAAGLTLAWASLEGGNVSRPD